MGSERITPGEATRALELFARAEREIADGTARGYKVTAPIPECDLLTGDLLAGDRLYVLSDGRAALIRQPTPEAGRLLMAGAVKQMWLLPPDSAQARAVAAIVDLMSPQAYLA